MDELKSVLRPGARVHMIGIGGVSMCALAEVLAGSGLSVSGSDMNRSDATDRLQSLGIPVNIGHSAKNLEYADFVIMTAAVHEDNPELQEAHLRGIPVFARAEGWGVIMQRYQNALCFSGTHGKTTSTSMATQIAMTAGLDPTVMIGGRLPLIGSGHRVGRGDSVILEACEYANSFLHLYPTIAVILNIEADHLDFFKDLDDIIDSFRAFALRTPEKGGTILVNADDPVSMQAVSGLNRTIVCFGSGQQCRFRAENVTFSNGCGRFDYVVDGRCLCHVALKVPGRHNVLNALAAAAGCSLLGADGPSIASGLAAFGGAGRRFEYVGTCGGAVIYDDYAHHPSEVRATLNAARAMNPKRIITVFQPHTYSRTAALLDDFARALMLSDVVILSEIYAAREQNTIGISSADLAARVPRGRYMASFEEIAAWLGQNAGPGDLVLTMGAGDIYKVGRMVCAPSASAAN